MVNTVTRLARSGVYSPSTILTVQDPVDVGLSQTEKFYPQGVADEVGIVQLTASGAGTVTEGYIYLIGSPYPTGNFTIILKYDLTTDGGTASDIDGSILTLNGDPRVPLWPVMRFLISRNDDKSILDVTNPSVAVSGGSVLIIPKIMF